VKLRGCGDKVKRFPIVNMEHMEGEEEEAEIAGGWQGDSSRYLSFGRSAQGELIGEWVQPVQSVTSGTNFHGSSHWKWANGLSSTLADGREVMYAAETRRVVAGGREAEDQFMQA